jgi:hypothetical protein
VLSTLLFDVISCVRNCSVHFYADDLQLYFEDVDKSRLTKMVVRVNEDLRLECLSIIFWFSICVRRRLF